MLYTLTPKYAHRIHKVFLMGSFEKVGRRTSYGKRRATLRQTKRMLRKAIFSRLVSSGNNRDSATLIPTKKINANPVASSFHPTCSPAKGRAIKVKRPATGSNDFQNG